MTWLKITDRFYLEPRTTALGLEGVGFHLIAMNFCADHLTNGYLSEADIEYLCRLYGNLSATPLIDRLIAAKEWERVDTMPAFLDPGPGYHIIHFLDDQPARDQVLVQRKKNRLDVATWRAAEKAKLQAKLRAKVRSRSVNGDVTSYLPVSTGAGTGEQHRKTRGEL